MSTALTPISKQGPYMIVRIGTEFSMTVLELMRRQGLLPRQIDRKDSMNVILTYDDDKQYRDVAAWCGDAQGIGLVYFVHIDRY